MSKCAQVIQYNKEDSPSHGPMYRLLSVALIGSAMCLLSGTQHVNIDHESKAQVGMIPLAAGYIAGLTKFGSSLRVQLRKRVDSAGEDPCLNQETRLSLH